jgi:hypothetical protein
MDMQTIGRNPYDARHIALSPAEEAAFRRALFSAAPLPTPPPSLLFVPAAPLPPPAAAAARPPFSSVRDLARGFSLITGGGGARQPPGARLACPLDLAAAAAAWGAPGGVFARPAIMLNLATELESAAAAATTDDALADAARALLVVAARGGEAVAALAGAAAALPPAGWALARQWLATAAAPAGEVAACAAAGASELGCGPSTDHACSAQFGPGGTLTSLATAPRVPAPPGAVAKLAMAPLAAACRASLARMHAAAGALPPARFVADPSARGVLTLLANLAAANEDGAALRGVRPMPAAAFSLRFLTAPLVAAHVADAGGGAAAELLLLLLRAAPGESPQEAALTAALPALLEPAAAAAVLSAEVEFLRASNHADDAGFKTAYSIQRMRGGIGGIRRGTMLLPDILLHVARGVAASGSPARLLAPPYIQFADALGGRVETGADWGGLTAEFFTVAGAAAVAPAAGFFAPLLPGASADRSRWFSGAPRAPLAADPPAGSAPAVCGAEHAAVIAAWADGWRNLGRLMGMALAQGRTLGLGLPAAAYRVLLADEAALLDGRVLSLDDYASVDPVTSVTACVARSPTSRWTTRCLTRRASPASARLPLPPFPSAPALQPPPLLRPLPQVRLPQGHALRRRARARAGPAGRRRRPPPPQPRRGGRLCRPAGRPQGGLPPSRRRAARGAAAAAVAGRGAAGRRPHRRRRAAARARRLLGRLHGELAASAVAVGAPRRARQRRALALPRLRHRVAAHPGGRRRNPHLKNGLHGGGPARRQQAARSAHVLQVAGYARVRDGGHPRQQDRRRPRLRRRRRLRHRLS